MQGKCRVSPSAQKSRIDLLDCDQSVHFLEYHSALLSHTYNIYYDHRNELYCFFVQHKMLLFVFYGKIDGLCGLFCGYGVVSKIARVVVYILC